MRMSSRNAIEAEANARRNEIAGLDLRIKEWQSLIDDANKKRAVHVGILHDLQADLDAPADTTAKAVG